MKRKSFLLAAATGVTFLFKPFTSSAKASKSAKSKNEGSANEFTRLSNGYGLTEWKGNYYLIGPSSLNEFDQKNMLSLIKHRQIARIDAVDLGRLNTIHEKIALS